MEIYKNNQLVFEKDKIIKDFIRNVTAQKTQYLLLESQYYYWSRQTDFNYNNSVIETSFKTQIHEILNNEIYRIGADFDIIISTFKKNIADVKCCGELLKYLYDFLKVDEASNFNKALKTNNIFDLKREQIKELYQFGCSKDLIYVSELANYRIFYRYMYNESID